MALEAKDLMIDDWVKVKSTQKPVKVKEIKQNCIYTENNGYEYDEIESILLTAEILEKNEFCDDGDGVPGDNNSYFIPIYSGFDNGKWEVHIEPSEGIGDFSGRLRFVHQLQHALKLCGIEKQIEL